MPNNHRVTEFIKAKGFYIALALCIVGASAAAWAAAARTMDSIGENNRQIVEQGLSGEEKPSWSSSSAGEETAEARKDTAGAEKPSPSSSSAQGSSSASGPSSASGGASSGQGAQPGSAAFSYTLPLAGEVVTPYSGGELVKNRTLNVWRTHDAVDIAGEKGSPVVAAGDGEVAAVSADALWGGMVQIRHPDGYTTSYAGLVLDGSLAAGDTVKAGQQLGTLGEIPAEISQDPHLHFALSRDGKAVDPAVLFPDLA